MRSRRRKSCPPCASCGAAGHKPNTIQRAYRELEAEGYINSIPGRGSFARPRGAVDSGRARELLRRFDEAVTELLYLGVTPEELCERISEGKEAAQA